jgi:magnesium chelatase accessory protein
MGAGPVVLLLHGTGATTHSWRDLAPTLAPHFTVVAPDFPGHGFTETPRVRQGFALPSVARGVSELLAALRLSPSLVAGHSAGAAVAARMSLDGMLSASHVVSLNGALLPFPGMSNNFFGPIARTLAMSPFTARAFTLFVGGRSAVERMMRSTGSKLDDEGMRLYARLAGNSAHVAGALGLMANWDLEALAKDLPRLGEKLILVAGTNDGMVPHSEAYRVRTLVPGAQIVSLPGLGHLAHEERPGEIAGLLQRLHVSCLQDQCPAA